LDGIRALAVLAVLAVHTGVGGLPGGFIGVDVFFVLSGFLITSLLLDERDRHDRVDLAAFWARRARRLLPAALLMITAVVAFRSLFRPDAITGLRDDALSAALWSSNWRFALHGVNYFSQGGTASPLQHTWSLAVEEQFYLLWPCLLALSWIGARAVVHRRRRLLVVSLTGVVASALLTSALSGHASSGRVYFGTDTRAQELLVGAALAAVLAPTWRWLGNRHRSRRSPQAQGLGAVPMALSLTGLLVLVAVARTAKGSATEYRDGLMLLVSLAAACLIAGIMLDGRMIVSRILSAPLLVDIGTISYGVYLWHWPIFGVLSGDRTGLHGYPLALLRVLATFAVATASYLLVERPARRMQLSPARLLPAAGFAVATVLVFATVIVPTGHTAIAGASVPDAPPSVAAHQQAARAGGPARADVDAANASGRPITVDVFGDSLAWTLAQYMPPSAEVTLDNHAVLGCGIATTGPYRYFGAQYDEPADCDGWQAKWEQQVQQDRPNEVLLMVGRWETMDRMYDGQWMHVGEPDFDAYLAAQLDDAITTLQAGGMHVVVANEPYNKRGEQPDGSLYPEDDPPRVDAWNQIVRSRVAAHPGVALLDINRELCPDGVFTWTVDGVTVRSDGVHLTPAGDTWLQPWLDGQLEAAAS
jgi:peptidoglycan/LPS O-acetylase OafA/YrhL